MLDRMSSLLTPPTADAIRHERTLADISGANHILRLDGRGGAIEVDGANPDSWRADVGLVWLDLDRRHERARAFVGASAGVDPIIAEAILADETRPRCLIEDDRMLLILRAVNLNPGADPEDMVSIRLWIGPGGVISIRTYYVKAVAEVRDLLLAGKGPRRVGELVASLACRIIGRLVPVIDDLRDQCDDLEDQMIGPTPDPERGQVAGIRRTAIVLKRYITPQREAMAALLAAEVSWLEENDKARMAESSNLLLRYIEDLDAVRERAMVIQEELGVRAAERLSKAIYIMSIFTVLFLPLNFVTGLMGMNVVLPTEGHSMGFFEILGVLCVVAAVELWLFRKVKWIR